jgi:hypothetical protein
MTLRNATRWGKYYPWNLEDCGGVQSELYSLRILKFHLTIPGPEAENLRGFSQFIKKK